MSAPAEPVVFDQSFEALLVRVIGDRLTPAARTRLLGAGIDVAKLQVAYSVAQWCTALDVAIAVLHPGLAEDAAHFLIGQELMWGLERTLAGKALFALGRLMGAQRMLERMTRNFRTSNNYLEADLQPHPGGGQVLTTRVMPALLSKLVGAPVVNPHHVRGLLFAAMSIAGAKDVSVELLSADPVLRVNRYLIRMTT